MPIHSFLIDVVAPVLITVFSLHLVYVWNFLKESWSNTDDSNDYEPETLKIYAERIDNTVLVYNADTHAFIVQVKTREELFEYFQTEFHYMNVIALEDNIEAVFGDEFI